MKLRGNIAKKTSMFVPISAALMLSLLANNAPAQKIRGDSAQGARDAQGYDWDQLVLIDKKRAASGEISQQRLQATIKVEIATRMYNLARSEGAPPAVIAECDRRRLQALKEHDVIANAEAAQYLKTHHMPTADELNSTIAGMNRSQQVNPNPFPHGPSMQERMDAVGRAEQCSVFHGAGDFTESGCQ